MLLPIANDPVHYPWGSRTVLAQLTGREPSGLPEAELWFGAHPSSPSRILRPSDAHGHRRLDTWIAAHPAQALGEDRLADDLPFLMKVLAAERALSIQVHPDAAQARRGFDDENRRGVPVTSRERVFRDARHKPELTLAARDGFRALVGFRPIEATAALAAELERIALAEGLPGRGRLTSLVATLRSGADPGAILRELVATFLAGGDRASELIAVVIGAAERALEDTDPPAELATLVDLAARRPGDPGLLVSMLLNHVTLRRGEAIYVPPGTIHAYLEGTAIEVMAASDNVVRGGLTDKHVDVAALVALTSFVETPSAAILPARPSAALELFCPDVPDVAVAAVTLDDPDPRSAHDAPASAAVELPGPAIVVVLDGAFTIDGERDACRLSQGEALFATPDERLIRFRGAGRAFVATSRPPRG